MNEETITLLNPIILKLDIESLNRRIVANLELIELTLTTLKSPTKLEENNMIEFLTYIQNDILDTKKLLNTLDENTHNDKLLIKLDLETYFKIRDKNTTTCRT